MKKLTLSIVIALSAFFAKANAQVGINTTLPAASLDITAKNATGTTSNVDGLLVPRVDRQRAQSMTSVPTSTLLYINSIATGTPTGTTINVDAVGYYYYNGTVWAKLNAAAPVNIYTSDGTLGSNRIVSQGANTLTFNASAVNAFSVAGTNFSVDAANNRVGIGTAAPASKLHVDGGESRFSNTTSAWALSPTTGGTTGALNSFEVIDRINSVRRMVFNDNGDMSFGGTIVNNSAPGVVSIRSGNVGVGNGTPTAKLDLAGTFKVADGSQGVNKLLISDANGLASWKAAGESVYTQGANSFGLLVNANFSTTNAVPAVGANYVFDAASVNVGTAYNTTTGVFTTPATGVYSINAAMNHVYSKNTGNSDFAVTYLYPQIKVTDAANNSILIRGSVVPVLNGQTVPAGLQYAAVTVQTTLPLKAGDKVEIIYNTFSFGANIDTVHPARMSGLLINRVQ